jgi:predicted phage tail component-like protein
MNSFIWKGKDSYLDFGIVINVLSPNTKPEKKVQEIEIQGRDGDLTIDENSYKPVVVTMTCTLSDMSRIEDVKAWLDGYGNITFNWQSSRYYNAKFINKIDISQSLESLGEFPLIFKIQPFAYATINPLITLTVGGSVTNPGTVNSKPLIKVYGTGSINLTINGKTIYLTSVVSYVAVDSGLMNCYKDTVLKNNNMLGDFPDFIPGVNAISWTGTVTKIEITGNWRYL